MSVSSSAAIAHPRRLLLLLGALAACGPISIDMYLPSLPSMAQAFGVSQGLAQWTLTMFLLGFSVGMLFYGPLSDALGRRPVLLGGIVLYSVATVCCALAPSIIALAALRFVEALGAGAAAVLARAIARDTSKPADAAKVMSFLQVITSVGPLLAPLIGGQLLLLGGWRTVFALLSVYGVVCSIVVFKRVPETWPREKRASAALSRSFAAYGRLLSDSTAIGHLLCGGMSYAAMFAYIAGTPFVYINYYHVPVQHYGYFFALNVVGLLAGNMLNARIVGRVGTLGMIRWASLLATFAALLTGTVCLSGIGGLPMLVVALFFVVSTTGVLGANCVSDLMHRYPNNAGAAAALFGATQFGLGAVSGTILGAISTGTPSALGIVIALCGVGGFIGRQVLIRLHDRAPRA